ncbi:MAG TPA: hypothetical protein DCP03_13480 [Polaromonas sp.]|uniref:hypothetical protein n=1 Tax=Polaromonas sp. UBA4122 TaxID=1947074 RepID=UPI000EBA7829|nr:hypothetical protein [Polaromonas sp. UBA4122]HAL39055.1 hypothetical protein [Polaromonas sp.]
MQKLPLLSARRHIDVCNGDADGLCSIVQWRLHEPLAASLVTGLKREIALLDRVQAGQGDDVLVCDLSMQRNRQALMRLLKGGARVRYFDHHEVDDIPLHPKLEAHIDVASDVCTSLLMDRHLEGQFRAWAVVGAFGDNLTEVADGLATGLGLGVEDRRRLRTLGEAINYNAYGDSEQDVHIAPAHLYAILIRYRDPLALLEHESIGHELEALRQDDLRQAAALMPHWEDTHASAYLLPDAPWSRRVIGCLGNALANAQPQRAFAILKATESGGLVVSVRAPLCAPKGAGELCRRFGGGGRSGAAGIDHLPVQEMEKFLQVFSVTQWGESFSPAFTEQR